MTKVQSTASAPSLRRPLVILFGWMGCQPDRHLRRYIQLYKDMGFAVHICVPTPTLVVQATLSSPTVVVPDAWPYFYSHHKKKRKRTSLQDLAWHVLAELDAMPHHPMVFFHVFSNAGCFLWEQVAQILRLAAPGEERTAPRPIQQRLRAIVERINGVIFDSGPGSDLHQLPNALKYATMQEQLSVLLSTKYWRFYWSDNNQKEIDQRAQEYCKAFLNDPSNLPQLYLFCENDPLAPHGNLSELVEQRRRRHGKERIQSRVWNQSSHCAHLYHHPTEYKAALNHFVDTCIALSLRSRL